MNETLYYELIGGPLDGAWNCSTKRPEDGDATVALNQETLRSYVYRFDASVERWFYVRPAESMQPRRIEDQKR